MKTRHFAMLVIGLLCGGTVMAQQPPKPAASAASDAPAAAAEQVTAEETRRRKDWSQSMHRKAAPKKGCFSADYPSTDWKEVPCGKSPEIPAPPRRGIRPAVVGNGNDIAAQAPSGHITQAIGHFENVTNVTSESGPIANTGPSIANAYTLQINTDFFTGSTACAGSPNPNCQGWEQWVYWNTGSGSGSASMQYWLIGYNKNCPAGQGWHQVSILGTSCWKNSNNAATVPSQPITNMANWTFTGTATSTGDSVTMSTGSNAYTASGDNVVATASAWSIAEFNIFGAGGDTSGGGGTATFNPGASADTRIEIIYGGTAAPACVAQGFTAEKNNLSFGPTAPAATAPGPAVIFRQSTAGGAPSNCAAAATIGDTHLRTFGGLLYDFQAAGDFTLTEVALGFEVQTRQVSGAPNWPNATVNKAVATRLGSAQVAICAAPQGAEQAASVFVDGKLTALVDGQALELSGGAGLRRQGNVYVMVGETGDSVQATVNSSGGVHWIDVNVGLGRWPTTARGLIANANGNVGQIATRDNVVLTSPFNFDELYGRFADSWRVSGRASLLAPCGMTGVESRPPERTFFAEDVPAELRQHANAVCRTAGVTAGALLDACTLDVAVIGRDAAAKVFVDTPLPVAVAKVTGGGVNATSVPKSWWWLLLLLIALVLVIWLVIRRKP